MDTSSLELKPDYSGPRDMVFVSSDGRTVFGWFGKLWFGGRKWSKPKENDIKNCRVACIDPFMPDGSEHAARLCVKHKKKYVTLDEKPGHYVVQNCEAAVISGEFIRREYPESDINELYLEYTKKCGGLIIFTAGSGRIIYGRSKTAKRSLKPLKVKASDTLGAGDTFRAGIAFGLLHNWDDDRTVLFASALASMVCTSGPGVTKSPDIKKVTVFLKNIHVKGDTK